MKNNEKNENGLMEISHAKKRSKKIFICAAVILVILVTGAAVWMTLSKVEKEGKTRWIGFENIGELDTQAAYCTEVEVIDDPREVFGIDIPFTRSTCIFSYDVVVKAGLNFDEIEWEESENGIHVRMPAVHVNDSYIDENSVEVYLEKDNIFSPISFEDIEEKRKDLLERGVNDALSKGLFDLAKENAEELITGFFRKCDEYKDMEITFEWEE